MAIPLSPGPTQTIDQPWSEELALTARIVEDIPPPVPVLTPLKDKVQVLPPESWKIVVKKKQRKLLLFQEGELLKWYPIDLGENPEGPKVHQGDMKTPEGEYRIVEKKNQGQTNYYLAFLLDYPNDSDRIRYEQALKNNQFSEEIGIGGLIEIHGEGIGVDWTQGCIALINSHMQELFDQIPIGTKVRIEP
jgi:murein L,D-transpeptidase YafK